MVPNCWETDSGHTVAICLIEAQKVFVVTRKGERVPTAHCRNKQEAIDVLEGFDA